MSLSRIAALVGIAFGAVFVLVNAGDFPEPWPLLVRGLGTALVLTAVWFGVVRNDNGEAPLLERGSVRTYWLSVIAEVIAIPVGAVVINDVVHRPEITVLWVVFIVGAHFLPAKKLGIARMTELGVSMMTLAVLGAVVTLTGRTLAAPIVAVLAGVMLLAVSATAGRFSFVDRRPMATNGV